MDFYAPGLAMQAFFLLGTVDTNRFRREQLDAVGRESHPTDIWAEDLRQDLDFLVHHCMYLTQCGLVIWSPIALPNC
jgi:hypothetical protein